MQIASVIKALQAFAPPFLQESYDNSGLLIGNADRICTGIMIALDATEKVIEEASNKGCNLVLCHHPLLFKGLKKITGSNQTEHAVIHSIKKDIAIYAIHTNLDNVLHGVNGAMADRLGLINRQVLSPKPELLRKLVFFVPPTHAEQVMQSLFDVGAGHIGSYSECSFRSEGIGSFKPESGSNPFSGKEGIRSQESEHRVELLYPLWLENRVTEALKKAHPYEEVAYDLLPLHNLTDRIGSGLLGELPEPIPEEAVLELLRSAFHLKVIRHTPLLNKSVKKIALCGGAGSFLTQNAIRSGADLFITSDIKYHEFFEAENKLVLADIGHWESEQFTIELLEQHLKQKFPTFAILKTTEVTNPVHYYL